MLAGQFRVTPISETEGSHPVAVTAAPARPAPVAPAAAPVGVVGPTLSVAGGADAQASFAYAMSLMSTGPLSHFDSQLAALYMQNSAHAAQTRGFTSMVQQFAGAINMDDHGRQYVTVDITARNGDGAAMLAKLQAIGLDGGASFGAMASGYLPVDALEALTHVSGIAAAHESGMMHFVGAVTSQTVRAQEADVAVATFGVTGHNIKVGVLSDSINTSGNAITMAKDIQRGDLPTATTILQDSPGGTDEGRGMAQLVYDMAPGTKIDFHTANGGQAAFANGILALAAAGDKIIVDDVAYFAELAYQDGVIAQAIDQVVNNGVTFFSSAGNNGHEGLEQVWHTGQTINVNPRGTEKLMRFAPGQDFLPIEIGADFPVTIVLQWDQAGASAGGTKCKNDLDLFLVDTGGNIVAASVTNNNNGDPVEIIQFSQSGLYSLFVGSHSGVLPGEIKIVALGNGGPVDLDTTAGNFNDGTRFGHTGAQGAISVAAVAYADTPAFGTYPPALESFSSTGFLRVAFDPAGHRLATPQDRFGPLISATDDGDTSMFGHDSDGNGHPNFSGTSAAAPDAAGVAALLLEARPTLTPADIAALLFDSAMDIDNPYTPQVDFGPDVASGAGLIQADKAVQFALTLKINNPFALELDGTHFADTITGGGQDNFLFGLGGNDHLIGGPGGDTLIGGTQNDTFVYLATWDSTRQNPDLILDLVNTDTIDLSGVDANENIKGDQAFKLIGAFDHKAGEAVLAFHNSGPNQGQTTISLYTNTDNIVDMLITIQGNHASFTHFDL